MKPSLKEWCFDVRPKGVGKKRPRPINELCSGTFDSNSRCNVGQVGRNIREKCSLVTVDPSVTVLKPLKNKVSTKRAETFWCRRGASHVGLTLVSEGVIVIKRGVQLQVGFPLSSSSVSVVFRQLLKGFQMCSASRRTLRAYTTPSSVLTRCSSVRSLLPDHTTDFHLSVSFGAGFPDPFPKLWKMSTQRFTKLQHLSARRTTHRTMERGRL